MEVWRLMREQAPNVPTEEGTNKPSVHTHLFTSILVRTLTVILILKQTYDVQEHTRVKSWSLANRKSVDEALHDNT